MEDERIVNLNLRVPKRVRNQVRRLVDEADLKTQREFVEAVCDYFLGDEEKKSNFLTWVKNLEK